MLAGSTTAVVLGSKPGVASRLGVFGFFGAATIKKERLSLSKYVDATTFCDLIGSNSVEKQ